MLRLMDRKTGSVRTFFVNDAHHHIGEDVDGNENVPVGKNGSYEFSKQLGKEVKELLMDSDSRYRLKDEKLVKSPEHLEIEEDTHNEYGLIDQFVVFPMKDVFRDDGELRYSRSNENISQWVNSEDHSHRLLGFGRVDPSMIEDAREEIKKFTSKYGLVGLKIHPDSERFQLDSNQVIQMYIDCARMNLPIIFHTGYTHDVKKIHEGVNKTISLLVENKMESLVSQLNVIIGHFSYDDEEAFRYLSHPCIYGEMSTLKSTEDFIRSARDEVSLSKFTNVTVNEFKDSVQEKLRDHFWDIFHVSTNWSNKLMLGTDHPFLPRDNIVDLMETFFCTDLAEELQPAMIQNMLGKNLIEILPVNVHMSPSFETKEIESPVKTKFEKRSNQVQYYIEAVQKRGVSSGPIKRNRDFATASAENGDHSKALKEITRALKIGRKAFTFAKMLEDLERDSEQRIEMEKERRALEAAERGEYSKGIKILKEQR